jgi:hypothetical protein
MLYVGYPLPLTFPFSFMRTAPFYSVYRGIAVEDLWHDNDACQLVLDIALYERLLGKPPHRKHCQYCQLLNQPWAELVAAL